MDVNNAVKPLQQERITTSRNLMQRRKAAQDALREAFERTPEHERDIELIDKLMTEIDECTTSGTAVVIELEKTLRTITFLKSWMLVMIVTYAEAYLEDILVLLVSTPLENSSMPPNISTELVKQWVKNTLRDGPPQWITRLRHFGAEIYPNDMAEKMRLI
jgi:hypothetical protein